MPKRDLQSDFYYFHQGTACRAYAYMGQHLEEENQRVFRVWAPNAQAAFLIADFSDWQEIPMRRVSAGGIWEVSVPAAQAKPGACYKYRFRNGQKTVDKADPYGFFMEKPPATASVIVDIDGYAWKDDGWLAFRASQAQTYYSRAMNIYEMHAGSWRRREDGSALSWRELAEQLAPYLKQMGYTHVELMPVMEHPFDGSWGYQVCGYYAPTARFGTPQDFMYFVDTMHGAGIGVILDWVPAHFPKDAHGLYEFDGQPLYEYQGADRQEHRGWGTRCFDVGREEVQSFLISDAVFWAQVYHADGLRVDAVAAMLYLDYDRLPGEWIPNVYGTNENLEASAFFRKLNTTMKREAPGVLMIAEESTAFANITGLAHNGLGFDLKWNMGWMNDTLFYVQKECVYRKYHHDKLTFSLTYAFAERYVLPISHDEVVHGKKSFLDKMPEDYWRKFAGVRVFAAWEMTHPGKKLFFMGCEIGQFTEWDYRAEVEWQLLSYDSHAALQLYFAELNHLYLRTPALWEQDDSWQGFAWMDADDAQESIISFCRTDRAGRSVLVILNFTPATYEGYTQRVPAAGKYREIFNSDSTRYGGSGVTNGDTVFCAGPEKTIRLRVPPLGCTVLSVEEREENKESKEESQREDQKAK